MPPFPFDHEQIARSESGATRSRAQDGRLQKGQTERQSFGSRVAGSKAIGGRPYAQAGYKARFTIRDFEIRRLIPA